MVNWHRGEIEATLNGKPYKLCLTLGALAELEDEFGAEDMLGLAERFENGRLKSSDAMKIISAGLKGAGHNLDEINLATAQVEGGAAGFVQIVAELLSATFSNEAK